VSVKTNIDLDVELVGKALKMTGLRTKKELVHYALAELVRRKEQKSLLNLRGKINWTGNLTKMRETRF
jgi:Arc/MetJ family transcription regulator